MALDLTDEEEAGAERAVEAHPRIRALSASPRLDPLKAILAKLAPPPPRPEPLPPLRPGMGPTHGQGRRGRR
jgi:hypothetical protein